MGTKNIVPTLFSVDTRFIYICLLSTSIHRYSWQDSFSYGQSRKEQVVLTRCRIGHSRLTRSYLLNNEERPECIPCNSNFSLKYVLIDCVDVDVLTISAFVYL
jgi:hypothetical protein